MNSAYQRGYRFERDAKKKLERGGYLVLGSRGSHSPFDLVAVKKNDVRLIQCKAVQYGASVNMPKLVTSLSKLNYGIYVSVELWVHENRKGWHVTICTPGPKEIK